MNSTDNPEVLAIAVIPSAEERKRRERFLASLLVITREVLVLSAARATLTNLKNSHRQVAPNRRVSDPNSRFERLTT